MRALISVYDKTGLVEFAQHLTEFNIEIVASGGTADVLKKAGIEIIYTEDITNFRSLIGGRVKTLDSNIHAGILADRKNSSHLKDLEIHNITPIDIVVCNLYPFQETLKEGGVRKELIEKIDIGGVALIRAAAKNVDSGVAVIVDPNDSNHGKLLVKDNLSKEKEGGSTLCKDCHNLYTRSVGCFWYHSIFN